MDKLIKFIFFGNIFYGICAIALSMEASLQQYFPLNNVLFYVLVFPAVVLYYNIAYITEKPSVSLHPRSRWYAHNLKAIKVFHWALAIIFTFCLLAFFRHHWQKLLVIPFHLWAIMLIFPLTALFYYGINHKAVGHFNLRDIGWLKPFIIGFSWAGLVTVYPVIYYCITHEVVFSITLLGVLLFVKNFMFISMLCILFDIKDYATDYNQQLKTFVVNLGLRKTIFYLIIPLTVLGLGSFLVYGSSHGFTMQKLLLNTVPFVLLIMVAWSLFRRRSIFYYLVIIDGLMLMKAICGITAMIFF